MKDVPEQATVEFIEAFANAVIAAHEKELIKCAGEPVGTPATRIYGSADCTMAVFDLKDVPVGTRLYTRPAPVQQVGINGLTKEETDASASVMGLTAPVQQDQRPKLNLDRQQEPANPFAVFQIIQERNEARDMIRKVEELNAELEEQNQMLLDALKGCVKVMEPHMERDGYLVIRVGLARAAIAQVEGKQ